MPAFSLAKWLPVQQRRVERLLKARLGKQRPQVVPELHDAMAYSLYDAGKRLRPILCLTFAGKKSAQAEDAACALEYVHTYSLIHDDLPAMDDDDLRRGRPTNHIVHGEALAILAGDALLTEAFSLVARGGDARLVLELAHAAGAEGMVGGQVLDVSAAREPSLRYLTTLHQLKTGKLIRAACRMGVIAGGGNAKALAAATEYGECVGLAFQIADDLLDVTGASERLGKPTGADAEAGRATFPAVVGAKAAREMAEALVQRACASVEYLEPAPGPLRALAEFSLQRKS